MKILFSHTKLFFIIYISFFINKLPVHALSINTIKCNSLFSINTQSVDSSNNHYRSIFNIIRDNIIWNLYANQKLEETLMDTGLISEEKLLDSLQHPELKKSGNSLVKEILQKMKEYDLYTYYHLLRTSFIAAKIASIYFADQKQNKNQYQNIISEITVLAALHDIGKLIISKKILQKPGKLTEEEMKIIKLHPILIRQFAILLAKHSKENLFNISVFLGSINYHHIRYQGESGYPNSSEIDFSVKPEIWIRSQIIALADVIDTATSGRIYSQQKRTLTQVVQCLKDEQNTSDNKLFDPEIFSAFLGLVDNNETTAPN